MNIDYIKNIAYTCPVCSTSIKFNVEPDLDAMRELFQAVDSLLCPKCKENLSYDARIAVNAIKDYNDSVHKLISLQKESNVKLD